MGRDPDEDSTDADPGTGGEAGLVGTWDASDEAENMGMITITAVLSAEGKLARVVTLDATDDSLLHVDGTWRQSSDRIIATNSNCRMKNPMIRTWASVDCDEVGGSFDTIRFVMPNNNTLLQIEDDSNPPDTVVFSRR